MSKSAAGIPRRRIARAMSARRRGSPKAFSAHDFDFPSPLALFLAVLVLTSGTTSCGGYISSSYSGPPPVTVNVTPSSAQPFTGAQVHFTASVQNAMGYALNWQVNGQAGGDIATVGMITSDGVYTAPATVPNPATVTVTAVLQSDPTKSGSASVTIMAPSIPGPLTVVPALSSLTTSQTLQLMVTNPGVTNDLVDWSADGGTITAAGLFTPPSTAGPRVVTATLKSNRSVRGAAQVEVTDFAGNFTWRNDNARSGQNQEELALSPTTVSSSTFGKLFSCPVDGDVYAQPLYVANLPIPGQGTHNVVFVATEKGTVYAFDADSNASPCVPIWQTLLVPAGEQAVEAPNNDIQTSDIAPFIGITGTPVIDASSSTLYVVVKTNTTNSLNPVYILRLSALDLATGQAKIQPSGARITSPDTVFSARWGNQRAALLLENGTVFIAFGSHHDEGDYHGWMFGYDATNLQQLSALDVAPGTGGQAGIWQSGGGPSADSNHNLFVTTGNGVFDVYLGGPLFNYGDSFLRLSEAGGLSVADYFSPCNQVALASNDQDMGSSAAMVLPDSAGSGAQPHLMVGGAKNGSLYVVNRDNLGGFNIVCPDSPSRVQIVPAGDGPIFSTPLFWNNSVYVAAGNGQLKAFPMNAGVLATSPLAKQSPEAFGAMGATPVISSNGASNAVVWLIDSSGALATPNTPAILRAYDASDLSNEKYNSAINPARDSAGPALKFTVPTVANGKVYVGARGELDVFGLLNQ